MKCMYVFLYTGNAYYDNSVLSNEISQSCFSLCTEIFFSFLFFFFNASVLNLLKIKFN